MGIGLDSIQMYLNLWKQGIFDNIRAVACLGSQELHFSKAAFEKLISAYNIQSYNPASYVNIENWASRPLCSAKPFFEMLGVTDYKSIDLNGEHNSLAIDLNKPLTDEKLFHSFDLVADHGTAEHVFNAPEAYRTMHRLCKKNGIIVILQILYPFNINHGFFRFDPNLFTSIAKVNNYKIIESHYLVAPKRGDEDYDMDNFHIPFDNSLLNVIDTSKVSHLGEVFVMQKQNDNDFVIPYDVW
jgi:SAM-dependent methyltransferase